MSNENKQIQGKSRLYKWFLLLAGLLTSLLIPILLPIIAVALIYYGLKLYKNPKDGSAKAFAVAVLVTGLALGLLTIVILFGLAVYTEGSTTVMERP